MPADNSIYNINATGWWNENNFLHLLKTGINPIRFEYFQNIINQSYKKLSSLKVLDVGCGGGFLSEEFARSGCSVTGLDLSAASLKVALEHARFEKLEINYLQGTASALPFSDQSFDIVLCCDVLEHVENLDSVLEEVSRLLKPGGLFLFDTINRTIQSYFETILVGQELPFTRFFAPGSHDWKQFITPGELAATCQKCHLTIENVGGFQPAISKFRIAIAIISLKLGWINFSEFGRQLKFRQCVSLSGSYFGVASRGDQDLK